jgi:predicted transcriptional regulator
VWTGQLKRFVEALKGKQVKQVMSTNVVSAKIDDHIIVILDQMIKNKYRRLPVLKQNKPIGVIYISDVYCNIFSSM